MTEIDWARVPVRELKQSSSTRKRGQGFLYIDDMDWIRRAYEVTKSKAQFAYALLLHRHCGCANKRASTRRSPAEQCEQGSGFLMTSLPGHFGGWREPA